MRHARITVEKMTQKLNQSSNIDRTQKANFNKNASTSIASDNHSCNEFGFFCSD